MPLGIATCTEGLFDARRKRRIRAGYLFDKLSLIERCPYSKLSRCSCTPKNHSLRLFLHKAPDVARRWSGDYRPHGWVR